MGEVGLRSRPGESGRSCLPIKAKSFRDRVLDTGRIGQQLGIPEAQHVKPSCSQPSVAAAIIAALGMLATVELDDQLALEADEVDDVMTELLLPPKLEGGQLSMAQ